MPMCPDCKAMAEEVGVLKERLADQHRMLVMFDAMRENGKLADLPKLPDDGVAPVTSIEVVHSISAPALQRIYLSEGRMAANRFIENASAMAREEVLGELKKRIRFAEPRQSFERNATDVCAYIQIAAR